MGPVAAILPCGTRLHLQHGPIDLVIGADGRRARAFEAARARFDTILQELVDELQTLRTPMTPDAPEPTGRVARRMDRAARPHAASFVTRMAAVAGAVADEVLDAMTQAAPLRRAYVNNGGDIAIHLTGDETFSMAMRGLGGRDLGRITLHTSDGIGGLATSGLGGRSLSLGIADSVTVLARNAAAADVAATLIANAVDLPGHPAIRRVAARELRDDSDLGSRLVVVQCGDLTENEVWRAVQNGHRVAQDMYKTNIIRAAHLSLRGRSCQAGGLDVIAPSRAEVAEHA
ncbi:MAG: UPF0280 family protein [Ruegeria sp.]|uniref:UPF0280 family protein n=1 Tax=Ruegeria sp. TaxID=1879320 RepID=UPI00349E49D2